MIRIRKLTAKDLPEVRQMDPDFFLMLTEHQDVLRDCVHTAYAGRRFLGACFLYAGPSFLKIFEKELPVYHLHMMISSVSGTEEEADTLSCLTDALRKDTRRIRKNFPRKKIVLRTWVRENAVYAQDFFLYKGFRAVREMKEFTFDLTADIPAPVFPEGLHPEILDAADREQLKAYEKGSNEAFRVANSLGDVLFQCRDGKGKIYVLRAPEGRVLSGILTFRLSDTECAAENIFTVPDRQKEGLAGGLLDHALREMKENGYKTAVLSVFGEDVVSCSFYRNRGFSARDSRLELWYDDTNVTDIPLY